MRKFIILLLLSLIFVPSFAMPSGRWWVPECKSENHDHEYHEYAGFELCYEEQYEQPMFVSYCLTKAEMNSPSLPRSNDFASDSAITTNSASLSDYKDSNYARGHLANNKDMSYSVETQKECFLLSNMSPQEQYYFNGGIWKQAETAVRTLGKIHDYCIVITGPILDRTDFKTIGTNKVAVPNEFYKIAVFIDNDKIVGSFALIMSQTNKLAPKASLLEWDDPRFITTIKNIENRTGLNFFLSLDDKVESYLENYRYGNTFISQPVKLDKSRANNFSIYKPKAKK